MSSIFGRVRNQHASDDVIYHALYAHYYCGLTPVRIAFIFGKCSNTVRNWISKYEEEGIVGRRKLAPVPSTFTLFERIWIRDYYDENPTKYLCEAATAFAKHWDKYISKTMVWSILHNDWNMTWKVCFSLRVAPPPPPSC